MAFSYIILFFVTCWMAYKVCDSITAPPRLPEDLPWIGRPKGLFSETRARLGSLGDFRWQISEVYEKYTKKGLSCIVPYVLGQSTVVVPISELHWIIDQQNTVLSAQENSRIGLQSDWTLLDPKVVKTQVVPRVVRHKLVRAVANFIEPMMDELKASFDEYWDTDKENWKEIRAFMSMKDIIARVSNRVFAGIPLCRNTDFIKNAVLFSEDISISGHILRLFPEFLKPVLAWLVIMPNRMHYNRAAKYLIPMIEKRIAEIKNHEAHPDDRYKEPNDFISWSIHEVENEQDPSESDPVLIAKRFMTVNFASIHTTSLTMTNTLLDLAAGPPEEHFLEGIREEVESVYADHGGKWTKEALAKLIRVDSAIRESMRLHNFISYGVQRTVVAEGGVRMKNGLYLPKNATVAVPAYPAHRDPHYYENPNTYDAFRFSRPFEKFLALKEESTKTEKSDGQAQQDHKEELSKFMEYKKISAVTTGAHFMHFGHGREACPGRFFAIQQLKLLIVHMIMNYDIQPLAKRPPNIWLGGLVFPPMKATLRIKRRQPPIILQA